MKKTALLVTVAAMASFMNSQAHAGDEQVSVSMAARPLEGALFRELARPVKASLTVKVSVPQGASKIAPLKVANVTFPKDMSFNPDLTKTRTCPESQLGVQSDLAQGIAGIVQACPKSVIGTGTAIVQLGRSTKPQSTIKDTQMVIFNGGRDSSGRPRISIYAFSDATNSGALMRGTLASTGELKIGIGVLPFDSSVSEFTLGIPGERLDVPAPDQGPGKVTVEGLDPEYLRATCSYGMWRATGEFVVGERDYPSGVPTGPESDLRSAPFELPCEGRAGRARLNLKVLASPAAGQSRTWVSFRVLIRNSGSASARNVVLRANGSASGRQSVGVLGPNASRTLRIRAKTREIAGRKMRVGKVEFRVQGSRTGATTAMTRLAILPAR